MGNHYPKGYTPQTYGEKEIADGLSTEQIQAEIDRKKELKKNDPQKYREIYCGLHGILIIDKMED